MLVALLFLIVTASVNAEYIIEEECLNYTVYPVQYEIIIIPHIYNNHRYYYDCDLTITVIANAPNVNVIELDAKDFEIKDDSIKVLYGNRNIVNVHRPYEFDKEKGKIYIYLNEYLIKYSEFSYTQYFIKIKFIKKVQYDTNGVFLVSYDENGLKHLFSTRLSPNKAKYFIPCFDNPRFVSIFKFKVYEMKQHSGMQYTNTSLVIAPERNRFSDNNYVIIDYMPSPQIALYQVGFHHSIFESKISTKTKWNDTLVVWAPKNSLQYYTFILHFGETVINLIYDYSNSSLPLMYGPINVVSVPKQLNGYEIGSWNLLTNGDYRLANVQEYTSIIQIEIMTFELTQQLCRIWLGNPGESKKTRWKEEWFKEGVATYLAYYFLGQYNNGAKYVRYNWPIGKYGLEMKLKAMATDWHYFTPAMITFNRTLGIEIPSRFKDLVTMKTASLLWMVENWLGSEKFHKALVKYINSRRGKFISVEDFTANIDIEAIECQNQLFNGTTASKVLYSWFRSQGFPVIDVNVLRDRPMNAVQLKQRQFSFTNENRKQTNFLIPISYVVQNNHDCYNCYQPRFTISNVYTFQEKLNGGWIILNRNATGYYRVNYDPVTWRLIAKTLKENHNLIEELNRGQIVNDVFALYTSGDIDLGLATEILGYLDNERSDVVWQAAIDGYNFLKIDGAACGMTRNLYDLWQEFMRDKVSKMYSLLVNDLEQQKSVRLFRSHILNFACSVNYQPCVDHLHATLRTNGRIEPDSRLTSFELLIKENEHWSEKYIIRNRFEEEDKNSAERAVQEERKFLFKVGPPQPSGPMPIVMPPSTPATKTSTDTPTHTTPGSSAVASVSQILIVIIPLIISFM